MTNGDLVVAGVKIEEFELDSLTTIEVWWAWTDAMWEAIGARIQRPLDESMNVEDFFGAEFGNKFKRAYARVQESDRLLKEAKELAEPLVIDGFSYKKLAIFDRFHSGWEMDTKGWIVQTCNGEKKLALTDHGTFYFGSAMDLARMVLDLEQAVKVTKQALALLTC